MSCVLTYDDSSKYCNVFRLTVRERKTNMKHSIVWSEVEFIEKKDDTIVVTGCHRYKMVDKESQLMLYDLSIVKMETVQ